MSHERSEMSVSTVPSMSERRRWPMAIGIGLLALIATSCAENAPQDTWKPAGENAQMIQDLQWWVFAIAGLVLVVVFAVVIYCIVRFRDRGQEMPEQTHGRPALEIGLTILPAVILAVVAVPTVSTVFKLAETDDTECVINVTGQQWWWEYDYPVQSGCVEGGITEPIVTSGQLVIPTGTNVLLRLTSRDVIHSYWIPRLNGKKDAVPGRVHTLRMQADEPGIYSGQCTEFCGLSHARMRMEAVGLYPADFRTWIDNQLSEYEAPTDELAVAGEGTFISQCATCHQVNGLATTSTDDAGNTVVTPVLANPDLYVVSGAAPNLSNLMTRNTFAGATWDLLSEDCRDRVWNASPEEFGALYLAGVSPECLNQEELREWLRNAPAKKPMFADPENLESTGGKYRGMPNLNLTEDQIDQLVAYLLERK
jgi:cytochrome c oxidase subunit II